MLHGSIVSADAHHTRADYQSLLRQRCTHETLCAWRGDRLVSKIALVSGERALPRVAAVQILSGKNSVPAPIPMHLRFLRETLAYAGSAGGYAPANTVPAGNRVCVPDILDTPGPVFMQAHSVQICGWSLRFRKHGARRLSGGVLVTSETGSAPLRFTWEIEVMDALLPPPDAFPFTIELWQYPYSVAEYYGVEPFSQAHFDILRPMLLHYKQMGGRAVTASIVEEAWG
ncbi:MAG: glycoside hydrolase domain-containing protein, partial [Oscillospiraceae bacterium]